MPRSHVPLLDDRLIHLIQYLENEAAQAQAGLKVRQRYTSSDHFSCMLVCRRSLSTRSGNSRTSDRTASPYPRFIPPAVTAKSAMQDLVPCLHI